MTDKIRGSIGPDGPPWPVDLLADLHAGVLEPSRAADVRARVGADPDARAVLDALDSVRADLSGYGAAPAPPMPEHFAARLDAAMAEEARRAFGKPAPVVDLAAARRKRGRLAGWGVGVLATAAAAVAVAFVALPDSQDTTGGVAAPQPAASQPAAEPPLALSQGDIGASVNDVVGAREYGPLDDKAGLDRCLGANDLDPAEEQIVGVRPVTLEGKPGVMALMLTSQPGTFRVLVVAPDCSALFNDTIN
ncbi:hypothetical protein ACTG9Q_01580 [Actinokineospora sp. 24-640]